MQPAPQAVLVVSRLTPAVRKNPGLRIKVINCPRLTNIWVVVTQVSLDDITIQDINTLLENKGRNVVIPYHLGTIIFLLTRLQTHRNASTLSGLHLLSSRLAHISSQTLHPKH